MTPQIEVDVAEFTGMLKPGSTLLISSDGLHGVVDDEEIGRILAQRDLEPVGSDLVDAANQMGGPDNITVLLARRMADGE